MLAQLVLHVLGELAQEGDLRRLDHNIERHLDSFSLEQVVGHSKNRSEYVAELRDTFGLIKIIAQLMHHLDFDVLAELTDKWLP